MPSNSAQDLSVVLVTGSYDHEIRFWEAWSGICSRTITRNEAGVGIEDLPKQTFDPKPNNKLSPCYRLVVSL